MNTFAKFKLGGFVIHSTEDLQTRAPNTATTAHGKIVEVQIHNFLGYLGTREHPIRVYSYLRLDGKNTRTIAEAKEARYLEWQASRIEKSESAYQATRADHARLSLGEPIKHGHHSARGHQAAIDRSDANWRKVVEHDAAAKEHANKAAYWRAMKNQIDLSMPESVEFYEAELAEFLANPPPVKRGVKARREYLEKMVETAHKFWD